MESVFTGLETRDFAPFKALSDMPMAMTAHVLYSALDAKRPATTSRRIVRSIVRETIGFDGLLMSDDLSMKALGGDFASRARASLAAGCDVVLHCNGGLDELRSVASGARSLRGSAARRAAAAMARLPKVAEPFDAEAAREQFDAAFAGRYAA